VTHPLPSATDVVSDVRRLLDAIGDALVEGQVDALLAVERELGAAVHRLAALEAGVAASDRGTVRAEIEAARGALTRCRRLGSMLERLALSALSDQPRSGAYTRTGRAAPLSPIVTLEARG
jgi:hypothetical protein